MRSRYSPRPTSPSTSSTLRSNVVGRQPHLLGEPVADVLGDGQRIEQRALLEQHADVGAHGHELRLAQVIDPFPADADDPGIRLQEAEHQLEQDRLARAARAQHDQHRAARHREADVAQDLDVVERQRHMLELDRRRRPHGSGLYVGSGTTGADRRPGRLAQLWLMSEES